MHQEFARHIYLVTYSDLVQSPEVIHLDMLVCQRPHSASFAWPLRWMENQTHRRHRTWLKWPVSLQPYIYIYVYLVPPLSSFFLYEKKYAMRPYLKKRSLDVMMQHNLMRCHLSHAWQIVHTHTLIHIYKHVTGSLLHHVAAKVAQICTLFPTF